MLEYCIEGAFCCWVEWWYDRRAVLAKSGYSGSSASKWCLRHYSFGRPFLQKHSHPLSSHYPLPPSHLALPSSSLAFLHSLNHRFHEGHYLHGSNYLWRQRDDHLMVGSDDGWASVHWGEESSPGESGYITLVIHRGSRSPWHKASGLR